MSDIVAPPVTTDTGATPGVRPPAPRPCGSCPYRCDVPAGVWDSEEYAKLPEYDKPTAEQPPNLFACHQQDGRLCAGWVGTHDMEESLALRLAVCTGDLDPADVDTIRDYTTPVPLFDSGQQAAHHGLAGIHDPDRRALRTISRLEQKRGRTGRPARPSDTY